MLRSGPALRELDENFVRFDHAEFVPGQFFDHFQAFLQVAHFAGDLIVALLRGAVFGLLRRQLFTPGGYLRHVAAPEPELGVQQQQ